jgi:hypothetical protein
MAQLNIGRRNIMLEDNMNRDLTASEGPVSVNGMDFDLFPSLNQHSKNGLFI